MTGGSHGRMAAGLTGRLDTLLCDYAERLTADHAPDDPEAVQRAIGVGSAIPLVIAEVLRFFADQQHPPGPCLRPRCGHPPSWHRLDDASDAGPSDPAALYRCVGYDPTAPGPPPAPGTGCGCPDMVREPDPRPDDWTGRWPPICGACGHAHTPGERCADHPWTDECRYRAGRYCGREHLIPDNVPPCGVVGHVGCTWQQCAERYTTRPEVPLTVRALDFPPRTWCGHDRPSQAIWWGFTDPMEQPRHRLGQPCTIARPAGDHLVVIFNNDGEHIRFMVQRKIRLDTTGEQ